MNEITRAAKPFTVNIGTTVDASDPIELSDFGGGSFHLPAGSGTTGITVYAQVGAEAYGIANDEDWKPLAPRACTAGLPYPIPPVSYHYPRIKFVASSGTATANVPVFAKG